jgi:hypothetical protein
MENGKNRVDGKNRVFGRSDGGQDYLREKDPTKQSKIWTSATRRNSYKTILMFASRDIFF